MISRSRASGLFAAAIVAGLAARLLLIFTTLGTNDAVLFERFAALAREHGVAGAYAHDPWLNHPPLSLAMVKGLAAVAQSTGASLRDLFRLQQVLADCVSLVCLLAIAKDRRIALFFFLSPVAIFISGFHANSDPTMVMFVLIAAALLLRREPLPFWSGVALALAIGIKIVPLLLLPFFAMHLRRHLARFAAGFAVTAGLTFLVPTALGGTEILANVIGYRGIGNWWGIVSMLLVGARSFPALASIAAIYGSAILSIELAAIGALAFWFWRVRRDELLAPIALTLTIAILLGAGFGVQYLVWPIAFLPFVLPMRAAIVVNAVLSAFLAIVYTHWSGGLPWSFADAARPDAAADWLTFTGWAAWAALAWTVATGVRSVSRSARSAAP